MQPTVMPVNMVLMGMPWSIAVNKDPIGILRVFGGDVAVAVAVAKDGGTGVVVVLVEAVGMLQSVPDMLRLIK